MAKLVFPSQCGPALSAGLRLGISSPSFLILQAYHRTDLAVVLEPGI